MKSNLVNNLIVNGYLIPSPHLRVRKRISSTKDANNIFQVKNIMNVI